MDNYNLIKQDFTQNLKVWARRLGADFGELTPEKIDLMIKQLQAIGYTVPGRQAAIVLAVRNSPEVKTLGYGKEECRTLAQMIGVAIYTMSYSVVTDTPLVLLGKIAGDNLSFLKCFAANATEMVTLVEKAISERSGERQKNTSSVTGIVMGKLPGKVKIG